MRNSREEDCIFISYFVGCMCNLPLSKQSKKLNVINSMRKNGVDLSMRWEEESA